MAKKSTKSAKSKGYVVAKAEDGTIQITYTIAADLIKKARSAVLEEYAKTLEIPGFRKGKAPIQKVFEKIPENKILEKTLSQILPNLLGKTIRDEKLRLAIYPKFELLNAKEGKPWQVRATTCEVPEVKLGDYKKQVAGEIRAKSLKRELSHEEKEQIALSTLIKSADVKIPKILLEEEVTSRISRLLERLEKLALSLEKYLQSLGKTAEDLKADYEKQAQQAIALDLALLSIAEKENITVREKDIDGAIGVGKADPTLAEKLKDPQQRNAVKAILLKKAALEALVHA